VPAAADLRISGLSALLTPSSRFYRVDTALDPPIVDPRGWELRVSGLVRRQLTLTYDDLVALRQVEADVTLMCVNNPVGGPLVGTARWQGVPLGDLLRLAGVRRGADLVIGRSVDGWTAAFPLAAIGDGRAALVALGMNGAVLPVTHGFPARLVVAGVYGYVSATKWLSEIELTSHDRFAPYWVRRGWASDGAMGIHSRIDVPAGGEPLPAGSVIVAGLAWAPPHGVSAVEVRVDDGPWNAAGLAAALSADSWQQWRWTWDATPGRHTIDVRATDTRGTLQPATRRRPFPSAASGWHRIEVRVTGR
jgi:DMSO/TMAO reductase YedYZ molybdopterin-dependent catalytic subunit